MKRFLSFAISGIFLIACAMASSLGNFVGGEPTAIASPGGTGTAIPTLTATVTLTPTATPSPTPEYPLEGYGPSNFPVNINPLTGLKAGDASLLERRPMIIKVSNLPRNVRPQWGLSLADQVYEYYIEEGTTRFAAVFYGQDVSMVGPIRSARFFDNHLIKMYRGNFVFGSADYRVRRLLFNQNYADRLVIESACPPMCRFDRTGANALVTNTVDLTNYINGRNIPGGNGRQNLDGLLFRHQLPYDGAPANRVYVRYSAAIYNRWDYDTLAGKYLRFSDKDNDLTGGQNEVYQPLTDRLTDQQISTDNLLVLYVPHSYYSRKPEIVDIVMAGPGKAMLFRNGQAYELTWLRLGENVLFNLATSDGKVFPFKPGNTFIEIMGANTRLENNQPEWRFTFQIP
jgi:hypothetical protein